MQQQGITLTPQQLQQLIAMYGGQNPQQQSPLGGLSNKLGTMLFGGDVGGGNTVQGAFPYLGQQTGLTDLLGLGNPSPGSPSFVGPLQPGTELLPEAGSIGSFALPAAAAAYGIYRGSRMWNHLKDSEGGWGGAKKGFREGLKPANLLGFGLIGSPILGTAMGAFGHRSTKQRQQDKWNQLVEEGKAPAWAAGLEALPGQGLGVTQDQGVSDKTLASGKMGGRDVWATSGMFDTFGGDWANMYDEGKREAIAKKMLDEGLFDSRKGVTRVTNQDRAHQIADEIGGAAVASPSPAQPDAGTLKRWRENKAKGVKGFSGR